MKFYERILAIALERFLLKDERTSASRKLRRLQSKLWAEATDKDLEIYAEKLHLFCKGKTKKQFLKETRANRARHRRQSKNRRSR